MDKTETAEEKVDIDVQEEELAGSQKRKNDDTEEEQSPEDVEKRRRIYETTYVEALEMVMYVVVCYNK